MQKNFPPSNLFACQPCASRLEPPHLPQDCCAVVGKGHQSCEHRVACGCRSGVQTLQVWRIHAAKASYFRVPEGHHPRCTTLREALRGNLPLRGLCGGLSEGSAGSLRGFCGVSAGFRGIFRGFRGSDPMLVTLGNCWIIFLQQQGRPWNLGSRLHAPMDLLGVN